MCCRPSAISDSLLALRGALSRNRSYGGANMKPAMSRLMLVSALLFLTTPAAVVLDLLTATPAAATPFFFSTGNPDGRMATASRPSSAGKIEIESGDDFVLTSRTVLNSATFTGLLTGTTPIVGEVRVEIYRVFPADSDVGRASGP